MSNILSYGVYFPHFYVEDNILFPKYAKKGKRIISYVDEDIITQAYESANNCLINQNRNIDAIFFSTTSPVFQNRYHSSFLAGLLGLPGEITALDFVTTPRAGTDALMLASQLVDAGIHNNILVVSSENDFPEIGEEKINSFGHTSCALLIGKENGIAEIKSARSFSSLISEEFIYKNSKIVPDARFGRDKGFKSNIRAVLEKLEIDSARYDAVILNSVFARLAGGIFLKFGFTEKQFAKDNITSNTGNTKTNHAVLQLINMIETGAENILLFDYFNGTNALEIHSANNSKSESAQNNFTGLKNIETYQDYLKIREVGSFNSVKYKPVEIFSSEIMNEREKESVLYLNGFECDECKTVYFIKSARCKKCSCNKFSLRKLQRKGTVYTLAKEHYFPHIFPPITMAVIDLDGGGRITLQLTDDMYDEDKNKIIINSRVKLVLRKMMEKGAKPDYFWKCKLI